MPHEHTPDRGADSESQPMAHPTTERVGLVVRGIEETIEHNGIDVEAAGVLLAHDIGVVREHDGSGAEIDHDPQNGPRLVLQWNRRQANRISLTIEPEPGRPRPVEPGGLIEDACNATHKSAIALLKKMAGERRWSQLNPECHRVEDLVNTHRHTVTAKRVIEKWIERTRDTPRWEGPPGRIALAELVVGLRDAADTTLRAGWKRSDDRGHPVRLELTIYGAERQQVSLKRYQRGDRSGRSQPVEAVPTERKGWATVELNDVGQSSECVMRCATMEVIDAYDELTRPRSSQWLKKRSWEVLLRNVALNWAWRDAAEEASGDDLCDQVRWYTW